MKNRLILVTLLSSFFIYNCSSNDLLNDFNNSIQSSASPSSSSSYPPIQSTPSPTYSSIYPPIQESSLIPSNFSSNVPFDLKKPLNFPSNSTNYDYSYCPYPEYITIQVYSNKKNYSFIEDCFTNENTYKSFLEEQGNEFIKNAEITYNNEKMITDEKGFLNLKKPVNGDINIKVNKDSYYPLETKLETDSCYSVVGLSPLGNIEKDAKIINPYFYYISNLGSSFPSYFKKDEKTGFLYFIVKNNEQLNTISSLSLSNTIDPSGLNEKIGLGKNMLVIFANNSSNLGLPPSPIDSVMELPDKIIFSEHKGGNFSRAKKTTFSPTPRNIPPCGDDFQVKAQAFLIPYSEKKLVFYSGAYSNAEPIMLEINS